MTAKLDDELARAIGLDGGPEGEGRASTPPVAKPAPPAPVAAPRRGNLGLLATLLVMAAALVALFFFGFKEAAIYAVPVDQLTGSAAKMTGRRVRIEGELVPGSLVKRDDPCEYRFRVRGESSDLLVRYPQCVLPDSVRDVPTGGVLMTVEGRLVSPGDFEATLVMAKCTSKYDAKTHTMAPAGSADPAAAPPSDIVR